MYISKLLWLTISLKVAYSTEDVKEEVKEERILPQWKLFEGSFKPTFLEQFSEDSFKNWVQSEAIKELKSDDKVEEMKYDGTWTLESPLKNAYFQGDKGLVLKSKAKHHAISTKLKEPIEFVDQPLVLQYEVKMQEGLECGGAYIKLLSYDQDFKPEKFDDKTPYTIMFGPDRCGSSNKVHFIFRHKNPKTGEFEEKHLIDPPFAKYTSKFTVLYTLVVNKDNTFEIFTDQESVKKGSLLENFKPAVNPEKMIEDVSDIKPSDWVEEEYIEDTEAIKPDDWDENEPESIADPDAKMPDGWLVNEPLYITDPDAKIPDDWNEDEDGEFIPSTIPNPKCKVGCGKWSVPIIPNPKFRGKWIAPMIKNPAYKGVWKPKLIPNPDYYFDENPNKFTKVGAIGFELWTMQSDILFDNIYLGHSKREADEIAKNTWKLKKEYEEEKEEVKNVKTNDVKENKFSYEYIMNTLTEFVHLVHTEDIGKAVLEMPYVFAGVLAIILVIWGILATLLNLIIPAPKLQDEQVIANKKEDISKPDEEEEEDHDDSMDKTFRTEDLDTTMNTTFMTNIDPNDTLRDEVRNLNEE